MANDHKQPSREAETRAFKEGFITHQTAMGKSADEVKASLDIYSGKLDRRYKRHDGLRSAVRGSVGA